MRKSFAAAIGHRVAVTLICFQAASVVLGAVASPPQLVFKPRVVLVPVDVRVIDDRGRLVTDLTPEDFSISEDGERQEIAFFSAASRSGAFDTVRSGDKVPLVPAGKTFLISLGRGHLEGPSRALTSLIQFVKSLAAADRVGVVAYDRVSELSTDHNSVVAFLERYSREHDAIENSLTNYFNGLAGRFWNREMPEPFVKRIAPLFETGILRFRRLPRLIAPDETAYRKQREAELERRDKAEASYNALVIQQQDLDNLFTSVNVLRYVDGEKQLIFVTEQPPEHIAPATIERLSILASDARVVVSMIQSGGSPGEGWVRDGAALPRFEGRTFPQLFALENFRSITRATGGTFSVYEYADRAFGRIAERSDGAYSIGYYPTKDSTDGKLRKISVRVARPGLTVLHRQSYLAADFLATASKLDVLTRDRMAAAYDDWRDFADISLTLRGQAATNSVSVEATLLPSSLLAGLDHRTEAQAKIGIRVTRGGKVIADSVDHISINLPTGDQKQPDLVFRKALQTRGSLIGAKIKVVVFDPETDRLGSASLEIRKQ